MMELGPLVIPAVAKWGCGGPLAGKAAMDHIGMIVDSMTLAQYLTSVPRTRHVLCLGPPVRPFRGNAQAVTLDHDDEGN